SKRAAAEPTPVPAEPKPAPVEATPPPSEAGSVAPVTAEAGADAGSEAAAAPDSANADAGLAVGTDAGTAQPAAAPTPASAPPPPRRQASSRAAMLHALALSQVRRGEDALEQGNADEALPNLSLGAADARQVASGMGGAVRRDLGDLRAKFEPRRTARDGGLGRRSVDRACRGGHHGRRHHPLHRSGGGHGGHGGDL